MAAEKDARFMESLNPWQLLPDHRKHFSGDRAFADRGNPIAQYRACPPDSSTPILPCSTRLPQRVASWVAAYCRFRPAVGRDPSASRVMGGSGWAPSAGAGNIPAWRRRGCGRAAPLVPVHVCRTVPATPRRENRGEWDRAYVRPSRARSRRLPARATRRRRRAIRLAPPRRSASSSATPLAV
jgi:hypothetical protein